MRRTLLTNVPCPLSVEFVPEHETTLHSCAVACPDVICSHSPLHCSPLRAVVDGSPDLPRGRWLHRRSRKAGPVPRQQAILLIEPDDDRRVTYAEYLHTFGFTVLTADTTDDGLTRASDADVIVTWIGVPGSFDGVELVRRVHQTDRTNHAPILVLLTACVFESDRQRALAAGCDLFLPKHCPPKRLLNEIRAIGATTLKDVEGILDKPHRRRSTKVVTPPTVVPDALAATMTDRDIARCAFERYEERGRERGHDIDDWLQAERDLQGALSSIVGCYPREMPGLYLRPEQVQRLCGIGRTMCQTLLDSLVDARFLSVKSDGHYALLRDGEMSAAEHQLWRIPVASANR